MKNVIISERATQYTEKPQHGAYARMLKESDADPALSMAWLRKCHLDPHTESYICGAQEMAIITKYHKKHILKNNNDDTC